MKTKAITLLLVSLFSLQAADLPPATEAIYPRIPPPKLDPNDAARLYRYSLISLAAGQAADLSTSWGRRELNPFLTPGSPHNRFGLQSAGLKAAFLSSSLAVQSWAIRRNPRYRRPFAILNFISAAALGGVALSNMSH